MKKLRLFRHVALALMVVGLTTVGCSGTEKSICDKGRQCYGGNDADYNACVQTLIYEGKISADYKCSAAFESVLTCLDATAVCETVPVVGNKFLKTNCADQFNALDTCEKAASTKGSKHFLTVDTINQALLPSSK